MVRMDGNPQIVGIGSAVYDTLMVLDGFPLEDTKMQGQETIIQGGGPCSTALVAASKLGAGAAYLGTVGDDGFGRFILDDLERWGVSTAHVKRKPGQVSFHAVVLLNKRLGTRTCVWSKGTVDEPSPDEIPLDVLKNARVLHLDGHMLKAALHAARFCRQNGIKVSLDAGGVYPGIEQLLPFVDYLIASEEFSLKFTGLATAEEALAALRARFGAELVAITQGERGGILLDEKGRGSYPVFNVEVRDSNGSGDTFHGAFLAARLQGMDNRAACVYASAAAAIKCTRLGARQGMPDDAECRRFLQERGVSL